MPEKRPLWIYTPPPWQLRGEIELVLFPGNGLVQRIDEPVREFVNAGLLKRLREERRRQRRPLKELLEDALRLLLDPPAGRTALAPLPPANPLVDLADPQALERAAGPQE